jgi:SAM-dependent methyltransferase
MHISEIGFRLKSAVDAMAVPLYEARGRRPWSVGYQTTKRRAIEQAIDSNAVSSGVELPTNFGVALDERVVEYSWLFGHLRREGVSGRFLDAGSALNHEFLLERAPLKGADLTLMTLAPEKRCQWHEGFSYVFGDLRETTFRDGAFDTVMCISTIEHVGLDNTMLYTSDAERAERDETGFLPAIAEFKRLLKPGGSCYITFPFGAHINLGWYQIFNQAMVQSLVDAFGPRSYTIEYFGYFSDGWRRVTADQVKNADSFDVHTGRGKGTDRAASSRAVACLRLVA